MDRRTFIGNVARVTVAVPLVARAQTSANPLIGFLGSGSPGVWAHRVTALRNGLSEVGYTEGQNVAIEFRWAEGKYDRLPALAADLVRRQVSVMVAAGAQTALAAKAASSTVPIVFTVGGDPVKLGLVASLNRPGGNVTGINIFPAELEPKLLSLLHELAPKATVVAVLVNPDATATDSYAIAVHEAARALGLQVHVLRARNESEIDVAFAALVVLRAGALLVGGDPFFELRRHQLITSAARHAIPAIYFAREFAAAGGLASYGSDFTEGYRHAGMYAGRILKGAKPADLPVLQATKIELVINLKTAKALGLTIPQSLRLRADEVIQ